jgi:hypothetical protein
VTTQRHPQLDPSALATALTDVATAWDAAAPGRDRDELAWRGLVAAGGIVRLDEDSAGAAGAIARLADLSDPGPWAAGTDRIEHEAGDLSARFDALAEATARAHDAHDAHDAGEGDTSTPEDEARSLAIAWTEARDRAGCAFEALRARARTDGALRDRVLTAAGQLGALDDRVGSAIELLVPARDHAASFAARLTDLGADLDPREAWWWFEPLRQVAAIDGAETATAYANAHPTSAERPPVDDADGAGSAQIIELRLVPRVLAAFAAEADAEHSSLRLAASSVRASVSERVRTELWKLAFDAGPLGPVKATLDEEGAHLVLLATDERGRPSSRLAGRTVTLQPASGDAIVARFEGVQATLPLGTTGLDALGDADLTLA